MSLMTAALEAGCAVPQLCMLPTLSLLVQSKVSPSPPVPALISTGLPLQIFGALLTIFPCNMRPNTCAWLTAASPSQPIKTGFREKVIRALLPREAVICLTRSPSCAVFSSAGNVARLPSDWTIFTSLLPSAVLSATMALHVYFVSGKLGATPILALAAVSGAVPEQSRRESLRTREGFGLAEMAKETGSLSQPLAFLAKIVTCNAPVGSATAAAV